MRTNAISLRLYRELQNWFVKQSLRFCFVIKTRANFRKDIFYGRCNI